MPPKGNIAVLDIGKTNKKLFVYDTQLNCLNPEAKGIQFEPVIWQAPNGAELECDDMGAIGDWMVESLQKAQENYGDIGAVSISAHGATIALLGEETDTNFNGGRGLAVPVISYENDIPAEIDESFYNDVGFTPHEAQRATATPGLSWLLNYAKTVYYVKTTMPDIFSKVTDILMLPQYLGYLLSGELGVEPTYLGCHGYLFDAAGKSYSKIAENLGVMDLLPDLPLKRTWDVLGTLSRNMAAKTGISSDCIVTMGGHDSNAALVPYLAKGIEDFVVQDSGTWVVTMAPQPGREAIFEDNELGLEVFYNRDIYGDPVKTTIFRGGAEFAYYEKNVLPGRPHPDEICEDVLRDIITKCETFALPTIERGAGLFPDSIARVIGVDTFFDSDEAAWHAVDLGLALQGRHALKMSAGENPSVIYIEGNIGRYNPIYRRVIATLFEEAELFYGSMGGAPFGAAILGLAALENTSPEKLADRYEMELTKVEKLDIDVGLLKRYENKFLEYLADRD